MNFLKRGMLISLSTAMVAVLLLLLRASPVRAQVENLCLHEVDGVVSPDSYLNISHPEACNLDETTSGITANNNSWGDLFTAGPPTAPNPPSGNGVGGAFTGAIQTVPDQMTVGTKVGFPINGTSQSWVYGVKAGGPAKSDLQQGATATYTYTQSPAFFSGGPATGDEILYYLVTRATNNGSELQGLWLFLGQVKLTDPACTSKCTFTGHHTNGDLFLLSAFTGGGGTVGIQAFQWQCTGKDQACDDSGTLVNTANGACSGAGFGTASNFLCGEVNDHPITVPGALPNPNTGTTLDTGLFYNGGVDVTKIFGTTPCFGSIMFESISSPSCSTVPCSSIGNADAKFFIFGSINTCDINVDKKCGQGIFSADQSAATYPVGGIVSNKDGGTLSLSSITDSPSFDSGSGSLECFTSAQSFNGTSCTATKDACVACESAVLAGSAGAPTPENCSSVSLTAKGTAGGAICYGGSITEPVSTCVGAACTDTVTANALTPGGTTVTKKATAICSIQPLAAGLNVTKNCQAGLAETGTGLPLEVKVNTGYLVCNEQPAILSNVTLSDNVVSGTKITKVSGGITCPTGSTGLCLAPEGQTGDCATFTGSYIPTSLGQISGVGTVPACVNGTLQNGTQDFLSDTATATGQCNSNVCSSTTGCTLSGSTVTCTAMGGASCPLCPLQVLTNAQCTAAGTPSPCCTGAGTGTCSAPPTVEKPD